jgi:hypothetical protein
MSIKKQSPGAILSKVGLRKTMEDKGHDIFDEKKFEIYLSKDYRACKRKEVDEVYGMREIVLIHKLSGMRICYMVSNDYEGTRSKYKLREIFIITLQNKELIIENLFLRKQHFITSGGLIPFSEVKKDSVGD